MRLRACCTLLLCLPGLAGCGKTKSTAELLDDLKSQEEGKRHSAVRLLPQHKGDAAQVVPALMEALRDKEAEVRRSAALGLGSFGAQAKEAVPTLVNAQNDRDTRVREAVGLALSRIDPAQFPQANAPPRE